MQHDIGHVVSTKVNEVHPVPKGDRLICEVILRTPFVLGAAGSPPSLQACNSTEEKNQEEAAEARCVTCSKYCTCYLCHQPIL